MSVFVVDASVALKWYVPEVHSEDALRLLRRGNEFHVPDLFFAEAGNILWKKVNRGELTGAVGHRIARALRAVPEEVHATADLLEGALELAMRHGCTVYDALYVALAVAEDLHLVTADRRLFQRMAKTPFARHVRWVEDPSLAA